MSVPTVVVDAHRPHLVTFYHNGGHFERDLLGAVLLLFGYDDDRATISVVVRMQQDLLTALESTALKPYLDRLRVLFEANPELRVCVRELATTLAALAAEPQAVNHESTSDLVPASTAKTGTASTSVAERRSELREQQSTSASRLELGASAPETIVRWPAPASDSYVLPAEDDDLRLVAERCRLKLEAVRWSAERQRRGGDGFAEDLASRYGELVAKAQAMPDCYLWMCRSDFFLFNPTEYDQLAGCFEAAAEAAESIDQLLANGERSESMEVSLHLAAETQSALRVAVESASPFHPDFDQRRLFHWLRSSAGQHGVWISRYMKLDDSADPSSWPDLLRRWGDVKESQSQSKERDKRRKKALNKLKFLVARRSEIPEAERLENWQAALQTITELVQDGVQPSNAELRETLAPVFHELPAGLEQSKEVGLVVREIERSLSLRPPESHELRPETPSDEVLQVAKRIRGRAAVFIGGVKRLDAAEAIERAFELSELIWIEGRDQSFYTFESQVSRPDVAVVLLAIRWSRHGFSDVKLFCDRYDKLLVRLPTGYSPNIIAHHVMSQVGERL